MRRYVVGATARRAPTAACALRNFRALAAQFLQKRFAFALEFFVQPSGAIAITARPWFCSILMTTVSARMRIFHAEQFEKFFPVRSFFSQRRITETGFHSARRAVGRDAGLIHIVYVLVARD